MWKLKFLTGSEAGKSISLKNGEFTVGRAAECDISINASGVSKLHALLSVTEAEVVVSDKGSSNGTFVNGQRVQARKIQAGDRIGFHNIVMELQRTVPSHLHVVEGPSTSSGGQNWNKTNSSVPPIPGNTPVAYGQTALSTQPSGHVSIAQR